MRTCLAAILLCALSVFFARPLAAQGLCPEDEVVVGASADTVSVQHQNAERNCCYELVVEFTSDATTIDFFEGATGDPCRCDCCFDLSYSACGFPAGTYTVRVWNEDGSELYGSAEIEVAGDASAPEMVMLDLGPCVGPTASSTATWSLMKKIYR